MFRLEHGAADVARAKKSVPQLVQLIALKEKTSRNDYDANSLLRSKFRVKRRVRIPVVWVGTHIHMPIGIEETGKGGQSSGRQDWTDYCATGR